MPRKQRVTAFCRSKSYSVLRYSESPKHATINAQTHLSDPWQLERTLAPYWQRSPRSCTQKQQRNQAFLDQVKGLLLTPPCPSRHTNSASMAPTIPKGLAFQWSAVLPCPHLPHYPTEKPHCLPETIPGSTQVSCSSDCPRQQHFINTSTVSIPWPQTCPSVSPNQTVSFLSTGMVLCVSPADGAPVDDPERDLSKYWRTRGTGWGENRDLNLIAARMTYQVLEPGILRYSMNSSPLAAFESPRWTSVVNNWDRVLASWRSLYNPNHTCPRLHQSVLMVHAVTVRWWTGCVCKAVAGSHILCYSSVVPPLD